MSEVGPWLEEKIAAHTFSPEKSPVVLRQLLSAAVALRGGGGTAFGLSAPFEVPDAHRLYALCCVALQDWLADAKDDVLRANLLAAIRRNMLDVPGCAEATSVADTGTLGRLVRHLQAAGFQVTAEADDVPTASAVSRVVESLSTDVSTSLSLWLANTPSRLKMEWERGGVHYELAKLPELQAMCAEEAKRWIAELPHYYASWLTAVPVLELPDSQGFVAVNERGKVLYLDNQGDTASNGVQLGESFEEFWQTWAKLGFVFLDPALLKEVAQMGFSDRLPAVQRTWALLMS